MARRHARVRPTLALVLALVLAVVLIPSLGEAVVVSVADVDVSDGLVYGHAVILPVGETVSVGARVEDPTASDWIGVGLSYYGYDDTLLGFVDGASVPTIFDATCFPGFCFGGMENWAGYDAGGTNRELVETVVFPGVPLAATPRVRAMQAWTHPNPTMGSTGVADEPGLDSAPGGDDAHMRVRFEGLADGYTTITIGTGDDLGGIVIREPGTIEQATNAEIRVAVPEPTSAAALLAGATALASAATRRRRSGPALRIASATGS